VDLVDCPSRRIADRAVPPARGSDPANEFQYRFKPGDLRARRPGFIGLVTVLASNAV
jgi:hypothetical protein